MSDQVVYKYNVKVGDECVVPWPRDTWVSHSKVDHGGRSVTFWCVHSLPLGVVQRRVQVMPTGMSFSALLEVVSTAVDDATGLVWHLVQGPIG
jgi:hypothetical protein